MTDERITWDVDGRTAEQCPECGAIKYVGEPCSEPHAPNIPTPVLDRPITVARTLFLDWAELFELALRAEDRRGELYPYNLDPESNAWASGVRDALHWLSTGAFNDELIRLLGKRP